MSTTRRRTALSTVVVTVLGVVALPLTPSRAEAELPAAFAGCETAEQDITVGEVSCRTLDATATLGGTTGYSYFVPDACDNAAATCPTIYLLHGFGGDHRSMLGTGVNPSAFVSALTHRPRRDPATVSDPWVDADPAGWTETDWIDAVLISPHGRTLEGGFGPAAGIDTFWTDWNPRYSGGGDQQKYDTPPPRDETFLIDVLIPHVESTFGVGVGREHRALTGISLGGYGTFALGLRHPDLWSAVDSISGAHNFLFAPGLDPVSAQALVAVPVSPPLDVDPVHLPGAGPSVPIASLPEQMQGFAAALFAFGDPVADQAYFRGRMPRDLAMNARGWSGDGTQSLTVRSIVNDAIPRRADDVTDFPGYVVSQAFEDIVLEMNLTQQVAFTTQDIDQSFEIHPGIHSGPYWNPWLRGELERLYARLVHAADDLGEAVPAAATFDFRSSDAEFSVWGWNVSVDRPTAEFLELRDVSCDSFTVRGTGVVTVTVPAGCATGVDGSNEVTRNLGPSAPIDEPAGVGALPLVGQAVTVDLQPI
ncbi:MAG TPA: alpha/beta hydrolase-fold protein [Acidimicrobiales bacterium]